MEVVAKADIMTPDKTSQWFSEFMVATRGWFISISPRRTGLALQAKADRLKTLSIIISENGGEATIVNHPGLFSVVNGQVNLTVKSDNRTIGHLQRDIVSLKSNTLDCTMAPEVANKYSNAEMAQKYVHLDLSVQQMREGVKAGILAELYGLIPMTAETARHIRRVRYMNA